MITVGDTTGGGAHADDGAVGAALAGTAVGAALAGSAGGGLALVGCTRSEPDILMFPTALSWMSVPIERTMEKEKQKAALESSGVSSEKSRLGERERVSKA